MKPTINPVEAATAVSAALPEYADVMDRAFYETDFVWSTKHSGWLSICKRCGLPVATKISLPWGSIKLVVGRCGNGHPHYGAKI